MAKVSRVVAQLTFDDARKPVGRGGWRPGAGRKRGRTTPGHVARPVISSRNPVHVTLRCVAGLPSLRRARVMERLCALIATSHCDDFAIVEFSVMANHMHLMIECSGKNALTRGMHQFKIRAARLINRCFARTGRVFGERYHARELRTPREVRNALCYVLNNARHHAAELGAPVAADWFDPHSSAAWFTGWSAPLATARTDSRTLNPCAPARTWLLSVGWRRHGLLDLPATPGRTRARPASIVIWNDDLPAGETCPESSSPDESHSEARGWTH